MTRYAPTRSLVNSTPDFPNGLIVSAGNVLIGTITPSAKLSVSGVIAPVGSGYLDFQYTSVPQITKSASTRLDISPVGGLSSANPLWLGLHLSSPTVTQSGVNQYPRVSHYYSYTTGTDPTDLTYNIATVNSGTLNNSISITAEYGTVSFGTSNTERMRITAAGKVGIGTTAPDGLLGFKNTATFADKLIHFPLSTYTLYLRPTGTGGQLQMWSDQTNANVMTWTTAGNVGIGTSTPAALLDIQGTLESLYLLRANGANSNAPNLRIRKSRGTSASKSIIVNGDYLGHITWEGYDGVNFIEGAGIYGISNGTVAVGSVPSDLTFYTNPGGMSQGLERMRITAAGKTTIGPLQTAGVSLSLVTPPLSVTAWSWGAVAGFANKIILWDGGSASASNFMGFGISGSQLDYIAGAGNHVFYINGSGIAASFTGSIPSNSAILTVSAISSGTIAPFQEIVNATGLPSGLIIVDQLTSTEVGSVLGGKGTYTVSSTQSTAVSGISMQTFNARYERMRINNAGVRMTLPIAPTVGQVLAATDTSGTLGWSSGTTYYRQFMFTS